ncbi:hypothetical protein DPMN_153941 [Dreissena polymorpha]|uniref:Uncharacterized protein n=1 Tax=Dreissena polymorpha TaxID=45954 RepID=A0A9D4FN96_DREPO|nr:hypothetical protein DPMN_153941 [Dreissena polymorpha]
MLTVYPKNRPSLRSQSGWGRRLLVDFELLELSKEAAFVQYSAILQAVCLESGINIAEINDVVNVLVTNDLHDTSGRAS